MAEILGLVGSVRRWGNSELLVRRALQGALAEGATARLVRLLYRIMFRCGDCGWRFARDSTNTLMFGQQECCAESGARFLTEVPLISTG